MQVNPFYPIDGKKYQVKNELCIDLASEGVPDQATAVIVYATISLKGLDDLSREDSTQAIAARLFDQFSAGGYRDELILSTKGPIGEINRKVFCRRGKGVSSNSENILLPVACIDYGKVLIRFKTPLFPRDEVFVQIVGYYRLW